MKTKKESIGAIGAAVLVAILGGCSPPPAPPEVSLELLDQTQARLITEGREAVLSSPQSAAAWGKLGQIFDAIDLHKQARICYAQAADLDPGSPKWWHLLGLLQLQDQVEAALANLERAADLAADRPDAPRLRLAQALIERGRYEEALSHLTQLLAGDSGHAGARLEMGRIYLARDNLGPSIQSLAPCLTNAYTARPALLLLAQIHQRQGDSDRAAGLASRAARMPRQYDWPDPFLREVLHLRVDRQKLQDQINGLLRTGQLEQAEVVLGRLLNTFPDDTEGLLLLGRLHYLKRDFTGAEQAIKRHLSIRPDSLNGMTQLALVLLNQQRWEEAIPILQQAIIIKPDFAQAHYNLGIARSRVGDGPAAIGHFQDALRCRPGDVAAHVALAEALYQAGRSTDAQQHLTRSLELDPGNSKARRLRERFPALPEPDSP
jgi:tetratricopeptide (TPR) repeat protein